MTIAEKRRQILAEQRPLLGRWNELREVSDFINRQKLSDEKKQEIITTLYNANKSWLEEWEAIELKLIILQVSCPHLNLDKDQDCPDCGANFKEDILP